MLTRRSGSQYAEYLKRNVVEGGTIEIVSRSFRHISHHSEAVFSHSICPDCTQKLYPEFYPAADDVPGQGGENKEPQ